ncbi:hypothetical protein B0T17DRAFT_617761 [Bombardia bombarda]|uniref:Uncharacterized protein n=1 Tax=Bombardia bombarda TaxID=252184 RepID=A0AA39WTH8_9PEZI|nr:hypothetical protein B0T17DRAFT_617761 [Bombardia bombarda]
MPTCVVGLQCNRGMSYSSPTGSNTPAAQREKQLPPPPPLETGQQTTACSITNGGGGGGGGGGGTGENLWSRLYYVSGLRNGHD